MTSTLGPFTQRYRRLRPVLMTSMAAAFGLTQATANVTHEPSIGATEATRAGRDLVDTCPTT